jgi:hypothetical protein
MLKCNIAQIHDLNWVLAKKVKNFKIHYRVIRLYDKFIYYCKRNIPMRGLSMCIATEVAQEITHKKRGWKTVLCNIQSDLKASKRHFMAPAAFKRDFSFFGVNRERDSTVLAVAGCAVQNLQIDGQVDLELDGHRRKHISGVNCQVHQAWGDQRE